MQVDLTKPWTHGRAIVSAFTEVTGTISNVCSWTFGVPGRLLGQEAFALAADATIFAVADLPPVFVGRAVDLSSALLSVRVRTVINDPKGSVAQATHNTLDLLGGGFVKIAQVIAHSPALFPEPLVKACQHSLSQASTPPAPVSAVEQIIAQELGVAKLSDVFSYFEAKPLASASIAQVHAATLQTGEDCVVKVVRPRVRERLAADFTALLLMARLVDLVLGPKVVMSFVNASLEACVDELRKAVMAECDLTLERQNMEAFREWLTKSVPLRRAKLSGTVRVPRTYFRASASRVLTMERIDGVPLSEICTPGKQRTNNNWQDALTDALSVAALSIIDGPALFHADLHSGNMIVVPGTNGCCDSVAFIDFGCCGQLPGPLRSTLLMQVSAFASVKPDVRQFTRGFAHALENMPGLAVQTSKLDTDALAEDIKPVLEELRRLNPFQPGANHSDAELHYTLLRLQSILCRHGVQLPREFTLLIKTGCFGALYFSLLDDSHRSLLVSKLILTAAAFASSNPNDVRQMLSPRVLAALFRSLRQKDRSILLSAAAPQLGCTTAALVVSSLPILWALMQYLA